MKRVCGLAAGALVLILSLFGCTAQPSTTPPSEPRQSRLDSAEETPAPGITRLSETEVRAVGTLVYVRKKEYFALVNAEPDEELTGREQIVAIVNSPEGGTHGQDLVALIGAYVAFEGKSVESSSATDPFPRVAAESMRIIEVPEAE